MVYYLSNLCPQLATVALLSHMNTLFSLVVIPCMGNQLILKKAVRNIKL